jgi:putative ABC transport system permease protein
VRSEVRHLDKDVAPSSTRTIEQLLLASVGSRRFNTDLIAIAGVSSLLLSMIGVYSVTAFSMTRRTREIGIRITLGARPSQIVRSMLVSECTPVVIGLLAGIAGAAFVSRFLSAVLFATNGVEPALIVAAAAFFGLAALIASYVPLRHATQSDPVAALKE